MTQASIKSSCVTIYTTLLCPFCTRAKLLLKSKGVSFNEIRVDFSMEKRREMEVEANSHTVPQIWIGDYHVGGCDELYQLERTGDLDQYLENLQ